MTKATTMKDSTNEKGHNCERFNKRQRPQLRKIQQKTKATTMKDSTNDEGHNCERFNKRQRPQL